MRFLHPKTAMGRRILLIALGFLLGAALTIGVFPAAPTPNRAAAAQPTPLAPPLPPKIPLEQLRRGDSHKERDRLPVETREKLSDKPCIDGKADNYYPCSNVDLLSFLPLSEIGGGYGSSSWGWTDPETKKEYALMGRSTGTSFVDITNPKKPVYLGNLPSHTGESWWRELKTYGHYAFIVSDRNDAHGMQVFDLHELRNVTNPPVTFGEGAHYAGFDTGHTITVNEATGYAYVNGTNTCAGGLHIVDVRSPLNPKFVRCFADDGYTHDAQCVVYHGPDVAYEGREICFNANEDTLTLVDVTDKQTPKQLARQSYLDFGYAHQGWLTDDHAYFLMDDETDETEFAHTSYTYIWDVRDLDTPLLIGTFHAKFRAIDHNQYIVGDRVYQANYRAGLRVLDTTNAASAKLREVGFFDIYPDDDAPQFNGAWNVYPFHESGVVTIAGIEQGLFVVQPQPEPNPPPCTHAPGATTLLAPQAHATISKPRVKLKWATEGCASTYTVLLHEKLAQGKVLRERVDVTGTKYKTVPLEAGKMYVWKIRTCNAWGCKKSVGRVFLVQ